MLLGELDWSPNLLFGLLIFAVVSLNDFVHSIVSVRRKREGEMKKAVTQEA